MEDDDYTNSPDDYQDDFDEEGEQEENDMSDGDNDNEEDEDEEKPQASGVLDLTKEPVLDFTKAETPEEVRKKAKEENAKKLADAQNELFSNNNNAPKQPPGEPFYVYMYVGDKMMEKIQIDHRLMSYHALFEEYMLKPREDKQNHEWKIVYHTYLKEADDQAQFWRKKTPTDVDVYAYLVWKAAKNMGDLDFTAGPRAIYFSWSRIPRDLRETCLTVDSMTATHSRVPFLADRFKNELRINLRAIGDIEAMYRISDTSCQVTSMHNDSKSLDKSWDTYIPGTNVFHTTAHGCVVLRGADIPLSAIDINHPG